MGGGDFYLYINANWPYGGGSGCNSYAYAVSDYVFGEDAPIKAHKDFDAMKVGDVLWGRNGTNYDHVCVVTQIFKEYDGFYNMSGNVDGATSQGNGILSSFLDKNNPFAQASCLYSRY